MCGGVAWSHWRDEERERFWNDLEKIVDRVGNGYKVRGLGDWNGWVGDREKVGITV